MKKLLSLIAAVSVVASSSSALVACGVPHSSVNVAVDGYEGNLNAFKLPAMSATPVGELARKIFNVLTFSDQKKPDASDLAYIGDAKKFSIDYNEDTSNQTYYVGTDGTAKDPVVQEFFDAYRGTGDSKFTSIMFTNIDSSNAEKSKRSAAPSTIAAGVITETQNKDGKVTEIDPSSNDNGDLDSLVGTGKPKYVTVDDELKKNYSDLLKSFYQTDSNGDSTSTPLELMYTPTASVVGKTFNFQPTPSTNKQKSVDISQAASIDLYTKEITKDKVTTVEFDSNNEPLFYQPIKPTDTTSGSEYGTVECDISFVSGAGVKYKLSVTVPGLDIIYTPAVTSTEVYKSGDNKPDKNKKDRDHQYIIYMMPFYYRFSHNLDSAKDVYANWVANADQFKVTIEKE